MPNFALAPSLVNQDTIDYSSPSGMNLYSQGTAALSANLYELNPEGLHSFLSKLISRSSKMGWKNILEIPIGMIHESNTETRNLLDSYGEVTMEQIDLHVISYESEESRKAQDDAMMYHFLISSMDEESVSKINLYEGNFIRDGFTSGVQLLKP